MCGEYRNEARETAFKQIRVWILCASVALVIVGCRSTAERAVVEQAKVAEEQARIVEKESRSAEKERKIIAEKQRRAAEAEKRIQDAYASLSDEQLQFKLAALEQAVSRGTLGTGVLLSQGNGIGFLIAKGELDKTVKERDAVGMELARRASLARSNPPNVRPDGNDSTSLKATGSGFFVSEDGFLVTNFHVVKGARRIEVRYRGPG